MRNQEAAEDHASEKHRDDCQYRYAVVSSRRISCSCLSKSFQSRRSMAFWSAAKCSRGKSLNYAGSEENVVVGWKLSSISRITFLCINFLKTTQYTTRWGTLALFPGFHVGISYKSWFTEGFDTRDLKDAKALLLPDLGYWSLWE